MVRSVLRALAFLVVAFTTAALAQDNTASYNIGQRTAGETHAFRLMARNENCSQLLNFRFSFSSSQWLRPAGEPVVVGVPTGESRPLPVIIDLTQTPPGHYVADVEVSCENCGILIFRNCRFDRQHLIISVDAVAPTPEPAPPAPRASVARAPARAAAAPQPSSPAQTQNAPPPPAPSTPSASTPATVAVPAPQVVREASVDCAADVAQWRWIAALAAAAAAAAAAGLAATLAQARSAAQAANALAGPSPSAKASIAAKAHELLGGGEDAQGALDGAMDHAKAQALDRRIEDCEARYERCREELAALIQAQLAAMRALSALGVADHRQQGAIAQANVWTKIARGALRHVRGVADAPEVGATTMIQGMEEAHGALQNEQSIFAELVVAAPRLEALRQRGFARNDDAATAALQEMLSYRLQGDNMSDMNTRLQQHAENCRRTEAELAILKLLAASQ